MFLFRLVSRGNCRREVVPSRPQWPPVPAVPRSLSLPTWLVGTYEVLRMQAVQAMQASPVAGQRSPLRTGLVRPSGSLKDCLHQRRETFPSMAPPAWLLWGAGQAGQSLPSSGHAPTLCQNQKAAHSPLEITSRCCSTAAKTGLLRFLVTTAAAPAPSQHLPGLSRVHALLPPRAKACAAQPAQALAQALALALATRNLSVLL